MVAETAAFWPAVTAVGAVARDARDASRAHVRRESLRRRARAHRHAADGRGAKVGVALLDAQQRAQVLVPRFPPLADQRLVRDFLAAQVIVQLLAQSPALVPQVEQKAVLLPVHAVDAPRELVLALALVLLRDRITHLALEVLNGGLDEVPALGRALAFHAPAERHRRGDARRTGKRAWRVQARALA